MSELKGDVGASNRSESEIEKAREGLRTQKGGVVDGSLLSALRIMSKSRMNINNEYRKTSQHIRLFLTHE